MIDILAKRCYLSLFISRFFHPILPKGVNMVLSNMLQKWKGFCDIIQQSVVALKTVNRFMLHIDARAVYLVWAGSIYTGLSSLGAYAVLGVIFQRFAANIVGEGHISSENVTIGILLFIAYRIFTTVVDRASFMRRNLFIDSVDLSLGQMFVNKIISLDLGRLSDNEFIVLKDSAQSRGKESYKKLFQEQTSLISAVVGIVTSTTLILAFQPMMIFISFIPVVTGTIRLTLSDEKRRDLWKANRQKRRERDLYNRALMHRGVLTQLKLFHAMDFILDRFNIHVLDFQADERRIQLFDAKTSVFVRVVDLLAVGVMLFMLRDQFELGFSNVAKVMMVVGSLSTFGRSWLGLFESFVRIQSSGRDYKYIEDFLATRPLIDETHAQAAVFHEPPRLSVRHASFLYPSQEREVLRGCSLEIASGEKVMIVGRNGSGKTTLVRLLVKIYAPSHGTVCANDQSLLEITQRSWLNHVLYVTQESSVLDLFVDEAVAGRERDLIDQDRLHRALELSGANEFVLDLPLGVQTRIGEEWPGGVGFSTGQRKRLQLAAAFYRFLDPDVHIGIFDEPMANCDVETRELFYGNVRKIPNKTMIVIAHDPLYMHSFDRVVLMDRGEIAEDIAGSNAITAFQQRALSIEL
jgi:ATP-binding cassette subfamily B protein